jgi:hypothetical protein
MYRGPPGYLPPNAKRYIKDARGTCWPELGLVRGACEDHWLCFPDGVCGWESELFPSRFPKGYKAGPFVGPSGGGYVGLKGLGNSLPAEGYQGACSLPTLGGFAVFGAIGALAAKRGRRLSGALSGVVGAWVGCAFAHAAGAGEGASVALTLGGAYAVARLYDGSGGR